MKLENKIIYVVASGNSKGFADRMHFATLEAAKDAFFEDLQYMKHTEQALLFKECNENKALRVNVDEVHEFDAAFILTYGHEAHNLYEHMELMAYLVK
jgi:hypothetical protein